MSSILITDPSANDYLAYPHANGFADVGRSLVLGRLGEHELSLIKLDLTGGEKTSICSFPRAAEPEKRLWFDVAWQANTVVTVAQNAVWLCNLNRPGKLRELFKGTAGVVLHPLPSITSDGSKVVVVAHQGNRSIVWSIDVESGIGNRFMEQNWLANHFHFSPHDEDWIGFSHEGSCDVVSDRMWGWHREFAPQGKCVFDQHLEDPQQRLYVGHERWCFHETSALAVAYGGSSGLRGLYEVFPDGRPARIVSKGDRDWHCNISHDGSWAVVDTTGPYNLPGRGWSGASGESDILLVNMKTGARTFLGHSRIGSGHAHPHPVFSPDGRWIYFNNADKTGASCWVEKIESSV